MIDKQKTILEIMIILSISAITITMIVMSEELFIEPVTKEIEPVVREVDNSTTKGETIEKPTEKIVDNLIFDIPEGYDNFIILEALKGFNSIEGESVMLTIHGYWFMMDAPNHSQNSFEATISFFDESTGEYYDMEFTDEVVTEDGLLTAIIPELEVSVILYYEKAYDYSKIVVMEIYGDNRENKLYFLTTPIFLIPIEYEDIEKPVRTYKDLTVEDLIELGKILLPLIT